MIFLIDFFQIFGRFRSPSWGLVGDILGKNKATLSSALVFLVAIAFSVGSGRTRDRFWTDFGASGTDFGPILGRCRADVGRFWDDFWFNFDPIEEASSSIAKLSSTSISKQAGAMLATFWQKIKRSFEVLVCSLLPLRFRWVLAGRGADFGAILVGLGTDSGVFWVRFLIEI